MLVMLAAATAVFGPVQAQQYRWVDQSGKAQFGDAPPPGAKGIQKISAAASAAPDAPAVPFELARLMKDFPVTLYSSPNCKEGCELSRAALNKRGIPFKEVPVVDPDSSQELKRVAGALEVPTLVVGRVVQRGFEPGAFDEVLDSAGYPRAGIYPELKQRTPYTADGQVLPSGREAKKPAAAAAPPKAGPYDSSGLVGPPPKPGQYDPSGLVGPPPKPGQYGLPGEGK